MSKHISGDLVKLHPAATELHRPASLLGLDLLGPWCQGPATWATSSSSTRIKDGGTLHALHPKLSKYASQAIRLRVLWTPCWYRPYVGWGSSFLGPRPRTALRRLGLSPTLAAKGMLLFEGSGSGHTWWSRLRLWARPVPFRP